MPVADPDALPQGPPSDGQLPLTDERGVYRLGLGVVPVVVRNDVEQRCQSGLTRLSS